MLYVGKVLGYRAAPVRPKTVVECPTVEPSDVYRTPCMPQYKLVSQSLIWSRACNRGYRQGGGDTLFLIATSAPYFE